MIERNGAKIMLAPIALAPETPKQIRFAVFLLWTAFTQMAISILGSVPQFYPDEEVYDEAPILFVLLIILGLIIPNVSGGRNWARVAVIIFAIVGVLIDIKDVNEILRAGPFWASLDLIGDIALVAAVCLICTKPGSDWFVK